MNTLAVPVTTLSGGDTSGNETKKRSQTSKTRTYQVLIGAKNNTVVWERITVCESG